jgi:heme o synthase
MAPARNLRCMARPLVPSRLAPGGLTGGHDASLRRPTTKVAGYVALTKPRVIELLLMTTIPTMILAERGWPSIGLMVATFVGGALGAGGANAINMICDRDIDALMPRTQGRPLVTGLLTVQQATVFSIGLELAAFAVLAIWVNVLSALLVWAAVAFYVGVYTLWLKRSTSNNIVIGGAAGCVPTLVGWSAVTNSLGWEPWVLFAIIFLWTPPHTWALGVKYADDYRAASVPMLPAVASLSQVSRQMLAYTLALVPVTLILAPVADLGWIYIAAAVILGAMFIAGCVALIKTPTPQRSMRLFSFSISYVSVLFIAMAADVLV